MKICRWCQQNFESTAEDLKFYSRMEVPVPTLCPSCREQRRLCFRNERVLYRRTSDLTGAGIISMYSADKPYKVYEQKEWWSDKWDPLTYGREFDFSRQFFDQCADLFAAVPKSALFNKHCEENCEFVNIEFSDKNCYMCFGGGFCENCLYGNVVINSKNCVDCEKIRFSELCYELSDSERCFQCSYSQNLQNCTDLMFCFDCQNCSNCFGCTNLRNQKYCFFNVPYTAEEYATQVEAVRSGSFAAIRNAQKKYVQEILPQSLHRFARILNSDGCTGNYITNSKNCISCFEIDQCRDLKYVTLAESLQDSMDCYLSGWPSELCYESMSQCVNAYHNRFCNFCWEGVSDLIYCDHCFSSQNCFGCNGLRHKQYCILNKQYSKEEYEALLPKIIAHLQQTGEWGEFFPPEMSPFAYNETVAHEFFRSKSAEVLQRGWQWKEAEEPTYGPEVKRIPARLLPDTIAQVPDDILNWAIECAESKRLFRIQKAELDFYRQLNLPIPRLHPDLRHDRRRESRNPRRLWSRSCSSCNQLLQTPYAPDRKKRILCEGCYLKIIV